jgi:hypothetical protein
MLQANSTGRKPGQAWGAGLTSTAPPTGPPLVVDYNFLKAQGIFTNRVDAARPVTRTGQDFNARPGKA